MDLIIELLAAIFTLILFLIIAFYVYPRMKEEYQQRVGAGNTITMYVVMITDSRIVNVFCRF